jgi:hypothetical protein
VARYELVMKLVVDPRHWLTREGCIPEEPAGLRRKMLRVARIIEYGGPLAPGELRETLIECSCRPNRKPCPGLLWVEKLPDCTIVAFCVVCEQEEIYVHDWEMTEWADGPMEPLAPALLDQALLN